MMKTTWAIQKNLSSEADIHERMVSLLDKNGIPSMLIDVVPFSDELPDVPNDRPIIFYGGTLFTQVIYKSQKWKPGVFINDNFLFSEYDKHYGEKMFNHGCEYTTIGAFTSSHRDHDQEFFVRPNKDIKEFAGTVMKFGKMVEWDTNLRKCDPNLTPETEIVVSEPFNIAHEWRLFLLHGKVLSGSHYRSYFSLKPDSYLPENVVEFAEEMAKVWTPHDVFAMDVCESGGDLYVLECGSFNSCGFYESNLEKVLVSISHYSEQGYGNDFPEV